MRVGYGVPHLLFELRMPRGQCDGCPAMLASRFIRVPERQALVTVRFEGPGVEGAGVGRFEGAVTCWTVVWLKEEFGLKHLSDRGRIYATEVCKCL